MRREGREMERRKGGKGKRGATAPNFNSWRRHWSVINFYTDYRKVIFIHFSVLQIMPCPTVAVKSLIILSGILYW